MERKSVIRKIAILCICFLVGALAICIGLGVARGEDTGAGPRAQVDQPVYDFGAVEQFTRVRHGYVLRNAGDQELVIKRIKSSCGCTIAELNQKNLAPGESVTIFVTFNTGGRYGRQSQQVTVFTNDPVAPIIQLTIEGTVNELLSFDPHRLRFLDAQPGETHRQTLMVANHSDRPLKIKKIRVSDTVAIKLSAGSGEKIRLPLTLPPGESLPIEITFTMPENELFYTARITFVLDGEPSRTIPFYLVARAQMPAH